MIFIFRKGSLIGLLLLCAVFSSTAQSFNSLKKSTKINYNAQLAELLNQNDDIALSNYLQTNPSKIDDATSTKLANDIQTKKPVPLIYDAISRALEGKSSPKICQVIINAGCDLQNSFDGKTSIYIVLDFIATHPKSECDVAEQILSLIMTRSDFDINLRYQSLLPPFSYLIRENHNYLNKFSADYISDDVVRMFIEKGASVNTYDNNGNSLIAFALETENEYLQTYFIDNGINTAKKNKEGKDALYIAVESGNLSLVKQMIVAGYDLNISNLQNEPEEMKKYPDIYDYIADVCASKELEYDSLIFFVDRFPDKLSLVKERLDRIYYNDYTQIESARRKIIQYLDGDVKSIGMTPLADDAEAFTRKFIKYDPENKRVFAQEVADFANIINGVNLYILNTYLRYQSGFVKDLYENVLEQPAIGMLLSQAKSEEATLRSAISTANRFSLDNIFPQRKVAGIFDQISARLEDKMDKLVRNANRDIKEYNEYIADFGVRLRHKRYVQCINCEIDESQTRLPKSETAGEHYTKQEPGVFVMKNGDKQKFYFAKGKWLTLQGFIFTTETEFDTLSELTRKFLSQCRLQYCK